MFQDESRFGTYTTLGRSWKPKGEDFEVKTKMGRESLYLFGAVAPSTGELFTRQYEKSDTESMKDFLLQFSPARRDRFVIMILDRAGWHTTEKVECPSNIVLVFLPPVSPQLNPIERLWKRIKTDYFHNRLHDSIEDVRRSIAAALASFTPESISSICNCDYIAGC